MVPRSGQAAQLGYRAGIRVAGKGGVRAPAEALPRHPSVRTPDDGLPRPLGPRGRRGVLPCLSAQGRWRGLLRPPAEFALRLSLVSRDLRRPGSYRVRPHLPGSRTSRRQPRWDRECLILYSSPAVTEPRRSLRPPPPPAPPPLSPPFVNDPLDADAGVYSTVARGILDGQIPYRDLFDHKQPLLYTWYMLSFLLFGEEAASLRVLILFHLAAPTVMVYWCGCLLLGSRIRGYLAAAAFGLTPGLAHATGFRDA